MLPATMDTQAQTLSSVCPLDCPDSCSLSVTVEQGRLTKVDGSSRNPLTDGFICAKVRRYPERVYSDRRILHPLKRAGAKGEGRFTRITWDEALDLVSTRLRTVAAEHGADAILPYHYGGSNGLLSEDALDARFFHRLGACQLDKTICAAPTGVAYRALYGRMGGLPPQEYAKARAILLWGVNPSATSIHLVPYVQEARRAGAFVAVIDPRRTPLARTASLHLQPLPGTDVVLALAMIHEMLRRGWTSETFLSQHTNGFEALARAAQPYPPSVAARLCQVDEADILRLTEAYCQANPAALRCGWGIERNRNGGAAARAILSLPAVAGKFGVEGGGLTMSLSGVAPIDKAALARPDLRRGAARHVNMSQIGRVLCHQTDARIHALFVYNANPVAMAPQQNLLLEGLRREDLFTVVHEQVMTDTARFADVLLPATTCFEQEEAKKSYGHYYLQHTGPVIAPVGEAVSNVELFQRLSRACGFEEPELYHGPRQLLDAAIEPGSPKLGGAGPDTLRHEGIVGFRFQGSETIVPFVNEFPTTPSQRIELAAPELGELRYLPMPPSPYPLILLSPASGRTINSTFAEMLLRDPRLDMHPDDAAARGLRDGALVRIFNELGEVQVPLRVTASIRPGVVSLPKGMWQESSRNGQSVTALIPDHLSDPGEGACFNDARVEVAALAA